DGPAVRADHVLRHREHSEKANRRAGAAGERGHDRDDGLALLSTIDRCQDPLRHVFVPPSLVHQYTVVTSARAPRIPEHPEIQGRSTLERLASPGARGASPAEKFGAVN